MLTGKRFAIFGVANERSIAWAISQALRAQGAELAFSYVNEAIEKRVRPLAKELGSDLVFKCDVQSDEDVASYYSELSKHWGALDGIVHSVAYADKNDLHGRFHETSREGFQLALDVSCYSLIAIVKGAIPLMEKNGGSIITLSYLGAERVVPHYNVMGVAKAALESAVRYLADDLGRQNIRVNALSAGPIKTLAAAGIPQFRELLSAFEARAPLKRNVTLEDIAQSGLFLLSPMSSGVTGETMYVDCGYNITSV